MLSCSQNSSKYSNAENERRERRALERRLSEMEEEMKVNQRYLLFNNTVTVIYYINQGNISYKSSIFTKS